MSLNFDLTKIKNYTTVCHEKLPGKSRLNPVTETLIWMSLAVGLRQIKAENVEEWFVRLNILSRIHGEGCLSTFAGNKVVNRDPTLEELEAHIGLATNANNLTRAKFMKNVCRIVQSEAQAKYSRYSEHRTTSDRKAKGS